jgi:phasin family protein
MLQCSKISHNRKPAMNTQFVDAQKSAAQMLQGMQKLAQLNLDLMQSSFADAAKTAQAIMAAKTPQEFATLCTAEIKAAPEKATAYGRQVRDILTTSSQA